MAMRHPAVSAVVPAYNCAPYLAIAIDSILDQTEPVLEVIVVDDGSTDGTAELLAAYRGHARIRVLSQRNRGQASARNRGLAACRGDLVGFCDADDLWLPDKIERQLSVFTADPDLGVVYTDLIYVDEQGQYLPTPHPARASGWIAADLLAFGNVTFGTSLIRRDALLEIGGFDESIDMGDDYDLLLRLSARYRFQYLDVPLYLYRQRSGQLSLNKERRFANALATMRRFLAANPGLISRGLERRALAWTFLSRGRSRASRGLFPGALADFGRSFRYRPGDLILWKSLVRLLLGWRRFGT